MKRCITTLLRLLIRFYQLAISPLNLDCCRYYPTCSTYTLQAIEKYGPLKGSWLGLKRILRCHPFHKGGYPKVGILFLNLVLVKDKTSITFTIDISLSEHSFGNT